MCGIIGQISLDRGEIPYLEKKLLLQSKLIEHRGPDGEGTWINKSNNIGFGHRRLAVVDLSNNGSQPMQSINKNVITYNGEIYNYLKLKKDLENNWDFISNTDTEVILALYSKYKEKSLDYLKGMFSFSLWDDKQKKLFCARDRFGIKPFYYMISKNIFYFASEVKALLPFLERINTNKDCLSEYFTFQFLIGENTLFENIKQLMPGHYLTIEDGHIEIKKYWDINYKIDFNFKKNHVQEQIKYLLKKSITNHCVSDVDIASYLSGGIDSSLIYTLSANEKNFSKDAFHGRFTNYDGFDESSYAKDVTNKSEGKLFKKDIIAQDFIDQINKIIYHLDYPCAGVGSFPQYMISREASKSYKVMLGGQGGDEIFGGYARYLIAYLEQSLKAAIDGNYKNGNYVVTIESIIPNLGILREYKPLLKKFWSKDLFGDMDIRYLNLINRSYELKDEIEFDELNFDNVEKKFLEIFNSQENIFKESYFDKMTHFDFKCLLPALLQVEDRMSMAHGLESRLPFLDEDLVEFSAKIPADIKFEGGNLKKILKDSFKDIFPKSILNRRDKMGFPVPLNYWIKNELKEFTYDTLQNMKLKNRPYIRGSNVLSNIESENKFSRKIWGFISLELWYQEFHDKHKSWKDLIN
ncbi:asparagine synthase (glutamine-hydrolyzing) [Prochlorococcus marinus XMU1419]|uniref:asparagine synthase (glutamine-hydrolyzing) n=1 Tax=Prochlorococcus marinus TaxID=1219 RepID=UPI001ADC866B|nr:asparagine synthase (glutamine-hydrolyzing) [Prochlorococcus marinus]MBO8234255.1 asparagine synthase (glutamine-hydrolyzing) [Prochlorococcus marinus XMU1419]MBW3075945.1 asparagine synthase (glutamine-hydrolyzing) [Prochlorococcus marinus str. XMU1419]